MNRNRRIAFFSLFLFLAGGLAVFGQAPAAKPAAAYRSPAEIANVLKALAGKYPALARLETVGKSAGGREISILRLAGAGKAEVRPAVLITANLEGGHSSAPRRPSAWPKRSWPVMPQEKDAALLDARTIYIAPLLNPDGAEAYFAPVRTGRFGNAQPVDEDADGVVG